jgi:1-pyrroline-5-carboxylate dehydrogenase
MFGCFQGLRARKHLATVETGVGRSLKTVKMGPPEDFTNFVNAVIDESAYDKLKGAIDKARKTMMQK